MEVGTIFLDRNLMIRKFTPRISTLFHILPQDLGRPLAGFAHSMMYESLLDDVRQVVETGNLIEKDVQDRQGNWILSRVLPYRTKGNVAGAVLTFIDISKRKQIEGQLRRLSKVFMDAADPIIIEGLDRRIIDVNTEAEREYGWTRTQMIGKSVAMLIPKEFRHKREKLRRRCIKAEAVRNRESARITKTGDIHAILLTLSLLTDEDGKPSAIATIAKDITAMKEAQHAAKNEVQRRDHFLAMLSHELRNPLSAVLSSVSLLEKSKLDEKLMGIANVIRRQSEQMSRLLDDLLDVSRITHGKIHFRAEPLDLRSLADDAVQVVQSVMDARTHQFTLSIPDQPLNVEGDRTRLLQIIENLLTNAAKYTPPGGQISLIMQREDDSAVIRVRDNGFGIPPDLLETIFGAFVQSHQDLDRHAGGLGVGLTLVKSLVELHHGTVSAFSQGPGQGSEFVVRIPISTKIPVVTMESATPVVPHPNFKIVLVEDNDDSRQMLQSILQLDGFDVDVASNGREGLELILKAMPRVAFVDIGLPELNGYEVAKRVRQSLDSNQVYLVALTGYGREQDRQAVREAGFDQHLVKPLHLPDLTNILDNLAAASPQKS